MLHKERRSVAQHSRDHTSSFTQVRAAVRRKTLLLLWWIDGGKGGGECKALSRQGCLREKVAMHVWISNGPKSPSTVAMGLLL